MRTMFRFSAATITLLLLLTACSGADDTATTDISDSTTDSSAPSGDDAQNAGSEGDTFRISFSNFTEEAPLFRVIHTNLDDVIAVQLESFRATDAEQADVTES